MAFTFSGLNFVGDVSAQAVFAPTPEYYLWSWGRNSYGQLGLGDTTARSSPNQISSLTPWLNIAGGNYHSMAIKTDGTLWSWGRNLFGVLGLGNATNRSSPVQIGALTTWSTVSTFDLTLAVKTDGTMWSWGYNAYGQLGQGDTTNRSSPVQIGALTTWSKVSAGERHSMAIKTDGTLWTWGRGTYGALGLGDTTNRSSPVQVGALTNWSKVSANNYFTLAIKTDGTMWIWGLGDFAGLAAILGLGDNISRSSPTQIGALSTWSTIPENNLKGPWSMAIKTDGTLWSWGYNSYSRLGRTGTTSSPVQVGALTNWLNISASYNWGMAVKTDGTLWSWGRNDDTPGNLGLGDTTNRSSPVQIGALTNWLSIATGRRHGLATNN